MNRLKKLFSPSSLAATIATGLLLGTAVVALADECISTSVIASWQTPNCTFPGEISCYGYDADNFPVNYCCPDYLVCGGVTGHFYWPPYIAYGWCGPSP
jgi:hypothetical protein